MPPAPKNEDKTEEKKPAPPGRAIPITSLDQLVSESTEYFPVHVPVGVKTLELKVRCLAAREAEQIERLLAKAHPPTVERDGKTEFDIANPEYQEKLGQLRKRARSLALYWCCPVFHEARPNLVDEVGIHEFIMARGHLTDVAQDAVYAVIRQEMDARRLEELIHFT